MHRRWDCRVYVLVSSVSPLRVHVAREGLARFCTEPFAPPRADNLNQLFAHVTNYALNKQSPGYQESEGDPTGGDGSKRALSAVLQRLAGQRETFSAGDSHRVRPNCATWPCFLTENPYRRPELVVRFPRANPLRFSSADRFWATVDQIVAMTMLVLQPELARKKYGEQRRGG